MLKVAVALIFGFIVGYASNAHSQSLIVHGRSYHSVGDHNNANYGVGYRTVDGAVFGAYHNSEGTTAVYAGYDWRYAEYAGIVFAGALGYRDTPVMPMIMPYITLPIIAGVRFNVGASPIVSDGKTGFLVHSMLEYRF